MCSMVVVTLSTRPERAGKIARVSRRTTVLVVRKNGASTTITCTVAKNTNTCSDNTHTVVFATLVAGRSARR